MQEFATENRDEEDAENIGYREEETHFAGIVERLSTDVERNGRTRTRRRRRRCRRKEMQTAGPLADC
jgi:hypothetical protein